MCLYIPANPDGVPPPESWACRCPPCAMARWLAGIHAGIHLHAGPRSASPCIQVAAGHRTTNMQAGASILHSRSRSTHDALGHRRRYSDIKSTYMMQGEARMTRGTCLRIMRTMRTLQHVADNQYMRTEKSDVPIDVRMYAFHRFSESI